MEISLVVPIYNELENIDRLYDSVRPVLEKIPGAHELILVNDGSTDGSTQTLNQLAERGQGVRVLHLRRNYGQTAAMSAGIEAARGRIVVTMDGDLQNDPTDIPMMVAKLDEGYDLVHGWRKKRQDTFLNRRLPSIVANWIISKVTDFPVHDLGCTLKAFRREVAEELRLYGELHRYIPILAAWRGARCAEVVTRHHPRRFGTTKYGISRTLGVVLDLATVKYLIHYSQSPMRLFGRMGLAAGGLGAVCLTLAAVLMILGAGAPAWSVGLLAAGVLGGLSALQFAAFGLMGEMATRTYYESQSARPFAVREVVESTDLAELDAEPLPISRAA